MAALTLVGSLMGFSVLRSTVPKRLTAEGSIRTGWTGLDWALVAG